MIQVAKQKLRYEGDISRVYHMPMYEKVDIQAMIEEAYARGEREITIPRGVYRVFPKEGYEGHIHFKDMKDFTVNAYGVILLFQDFHKSGLRFTFSDNITVRGMTTDWEDMIHTQCKLIAVAPDNSYMDFEVDKGYPMYEQSDIDKGVQVAGALYHDFDGRWITGGGRFDFSLRRLELLGGRRFRFHTHKTPILHDFKIGDYFCPMVSDTLPSGTNVSITSNGAVHLEDYTAWSSPISCIAECSTEGGSTYRNVKIMPGPKPLGADHRRILSMSGDGFHLTSVRKGPLIENTYFEGLTDDGINIHGIYSVVEQKLAPNKFIIANHGRFDYREGDELRFYNENLNLIARVHVVSAKDVSEDFKDKEKLVFRVPCATFRAWRWYEVEVDGNVDAGRLDWVVNADCIGAGFVFRGCTFYNLRPRGALIKSSNGIVENCVFDHISGGGIKIIPENNWLEADYSSNITVRNNIIRHCGFDADFGGSGIEISGYEAIEHQNIVVENNLFEDNYHREIHLTCARDVTVRGNVFSKNHPLVRPEGEDLHPCIYVNKCKGVRFEDNVYPEDRLVGIFGPEVEGLSTEQPFFASSWASDAIVGPQGRAGWRWQYAPIGTNEYHDYPNWIAGHGQENGWWNGEFNDRTDGCILRLWWDTYLCPGTRSDVVKTYVCPKDGKLAVTYTEPIKAGDILDKTDGVRVCILKNDERIWPLDKEWQDIPLFNQYLREIHTVDVKAGDEIHFRVNMHEIPEGNGTSWNPLVYYVG